MSYTCLPSQVAELAAEVEEEGIAFYQLLAKRAGRDQVKKSFLFLSGQEAGHRGLFLKMAETLKISEPKCEFQMDVYSLLSAAIDKLKSAAFALDTVPPGPIDVKKNLDIAIHTEAESVKLYTAMEEKFPEQFLRVLDQIISEETKHLDVLLDIKGRLDL